VYGNRNSCISKTSSSSEPEYWVSIPNTQPIKYPPTLEAHGLERVTPHHIKQQLRRIAKSKFALSTVVTSLIILVTAVLLAGVVSYFAINVTSTRAQEESLALTKQHIWHDFNTGTTQAAIIAINTGGRDVVIDKLTVRGQECEWSKVFYAVVSDSISGDLLYNSTLVDGGVISVGGVERVFKQATTDLTLQSGKTLIYMLNPDSITVSDVGLTVSITIFTSQAMYYKETNVQGAGGIANVSGSSGSGGSEASPLQLVYVSAYYREFDGDQVAIVLTNPSGSAVSLSWNALYVDGVQVNGDWWIYYDTTPFTSNLPYYTGKNTIQGHTLEVGPTTHTVNPGQWMIIYYQKDTLFDETDVGSTVSVVLKDGNGQNTNTKQVTVQLG